MRRLSVRSLFVALVAAVIGVALGSVNPVASAGADPGVLVHPGMEIRQGANICTLGYVDPALRVAFTAGHCRADGPVTDAAGRPIGTVSVFRNNTPNGTTVTTDQVIADYEAILLTDDVAVNNVLPSGLPLESRPGRIAAAGEPVCHFGIITKESCGTVDRVNNGWFTMANGVVSQKGDSGGPVYVIDGTSAVIIGLFNSTWGTYPAAVSWQAAGDQIREDINVSPNPTAKNVVWSQFLQTH
ncbi:Rv1815 family serine proteinase [Mycolicibacterium palauense]|uniref:Rv1815 family serine proteinase n=1 Tax=Mycolicibacterium palauense TaxID=2034511 RepID=UPI000BFEE013|nr:hypothetical protein [Mycolicibacterium palauense]